MESEKLGAEVRIYTRSRVAGGGGLVTPGARSEARRSPLTRDSER